jgi:hypothetical protein
MKKVTNYKIQITNKSQITNHKLQTKINHLPNFPASQLPSFPLFAAGVYLPEGHHPIIPLFQHSIIPAAERSGAKSLKMEIKK